MPDDIPQHVIDALRTDLRKEFSKKVAGWAIAGGAGIVTLAALGAWTILKPTIARDLGIVPLDEVSTLIADGTENLVSIDDLSAAIQMLPSEDRVVTLISENNIATGSITEASVAGLINDAVAPLQHFSDMKGAVIAFDRSEDRGGGFVGGACPVGWSLFRDAGGRFIIGAGAHTNTDSAGNALTDYRAYSDDPIEAIGGYETVILEETQMPSHSHSHNDEYAELRGLPDRLDSDGGDVGIVVTNVNKETGEVGDGLPHDNLPPFIALYFCIKESGPIAQ